MTEIYTVINGKAFHLDYGARTDAQYDDKLADLDQVIKSFTINESAIPPIVKVNKDNGERSDPSNNKGVQGGDGGAGNIGEGTVNQANKVTNQQQYKLLAYENPELGFKIQYPSNWAKTGNDKGVIPVMFTLTESSDATTMASQQQPSGSPTNNKIKANLLINVQPIGSASSLQQTGGEGNTEEEQEKENEEDEQELEEEEDSQQTAVQQQEVSQQTKASLEQFSLKQINELIKSKNTKFNILESNSSAKLGVKNSPAYKLVYDGTRLQIMQK